jgi:hypothetical protein
MFVIGDRKTRDTFVQKKQKPRFIKTYNRSALHKTMKKLTSQTPLTRYPKKNPPAQKRNCCHRGLSVSDTPNSLLPCSSPDEPPMASPPSLLFQTPERERENGEEPDIWLGMPRQSTTPSNE